MVDASNPGHPEQIEQVQRVLHEIGASDVPQVLVFNKIDALADSQRPRALRDVFELEGRPVPRLFLSAHTGEGLAGLRALLAEEAALAARPAPDEQIPHSHEAPA